MHNHFINPYNFIPMKKSKSIAGAGEEKYSGVIAYSVLTKTPLFIPNTSNSDAFNKSNDKCKEHKSYDFFSYTDLSEKEDSSNSYYKPVITGSEMRGMLRSNYEILTNSCLSALDTDTQLSKRTNEIFKPGLIKKSGDHYYLYEAESRTLREKLYDNTNKKSRLINYKEEDNGTEQKGGYLIFGSPSPLDEQEKKKKYNYGRYHKAHLFKPTSKCVISDKQKKPLPISLDSLKIVLEEGEYSTLYKGYNANFKAFISDKSKKYFPAYYSIQERKDGKKVLNLSPAQITREIFDNTLEKIVGGKSSKNTGSFAPCMKLENLCPACSLFGMMNNENGKNYTKASKIRFSDLELTDFHGDSYKDLYLDLITLPELSSPKLNNMEFYVKKPDDDAIFWTYDYYVDKRGRVQLITPEINGRKFYWHNMIKDDQIPFAKVDTKTGQIINDRNMTIRPLKTNVTFKGELFFKNLTKKELDQLIWLIDMDETVELKDKTHGYKIGSAKPLGLGSIAMKTDSVMCRTIKVEDKAILIVDEPYTQYSMPEMDANIQKDYLKMTNFNAIVSSKVSYPYIPGRKDEEGFKWYVANHKKYVRGTMQSGMPNRRNQMAFESYMKPMQEYLYDTLTNNIENRAEEKKQSPRKKITVESFQPDKWSKNNQVAFYKNCLVKNIPKDFTDKTFIVEEVKNRNGKTNYRFISAVEGD